MFSSNPIPAVFCLIVVLSAAEPLAAGKLRAVGQQTRSKTSAKSKPTESRRREKDEDEDETAKRRNVPTGRLASVAQQTRQNGSRGERVSRARHHHHRDRHHHHHHHHYPRRSPGSLGFYFSNAPIVPAPILVEEYRLYDQPVEVIPSPGIPVPAERMPSMGRMHPGSPQLSSEPIEFHHPWQMRFGMEYGSDVEDLSHFGFDLLANRTAGFGIDTSVRMHRERGFDFRDHLWVGDVNLVYELFPTKHVRPRAGIGINWLADDIGGEAGLNLTLGVDVTLWERLQLTGEVDCGAIGDADLFHARATVGYGLSDHLEWFAGYDQLNVGSVAIDGLVTGIRFRF
ncbi:MAG: hypothetical protein GY768_09330 [Planctomycetaceae bacterium]|nr:hypothetical protein [Planctomycetaceae bacterium]